MLTLALYDITDDRLRRRVERTCQDGGLHRIQKSAFRGRISTERRTKLVENLKAVIEDEEDCDVQVYAISDDDFAQHVRLTGAGPVEDDEIDPQVLVL